MSVASQWLSSHHVITAKDMLETIEELLEVVFSVQPAAMAVSRCNIAAARGVVFWKVCPKAISGEPKLVG
jgi:hypothetical protein